MNDAAWSEASCPRCGAAPAIHRRSCDECGLAYELVNQRVVWAFAGQPILTDPIFENLDTTNPEGPQG